MKNKNEIVLSDRKRELLLSSVENYIETALPITSEKVQSNHFQLLSSATLRNELSALEEMGYLKQLHTSSGRIPTTKAYRYYVDAIMNSSAITSKNLKKVEDKFKQRSAFLIEVIDDLAKNVSDIIELPTYVKLSGYDELTIVAINLIKLITGQGLVLIQTNAGIINNTIRLDSTITEENCKDASKFLTTNLANKKISEILENSDYYTKLFKSQITYFEQLFMSLTEMLREYSKHTSFVKGNTTKLLNQPEYKDINSAKKFLTLVENEEKIKNIIENIDNSSESELVFSIGEENNNEEFSDYSIIKANYSLANGINAEIGVLGPERMDYAKIASALKYITDEINKSNKGKPKTKKEKGKNE